MEAVAAFVIVFGVALIDIQKAGSSDSSVIEYLLTVKLETWRGEVTKEIKNQVLNDTARSREHQMKYLENMYLIEKREILDLKYRVNKLEQDNSLLTETIDKLSKQTGKTECSCSSSPTDVVQRKSGVRLAIGEFRTGDILVIDTDSAARWTLKSPSGIMGIAYHPITMTLFTATVTDRSAIQQISLINGKTKRFKRCVHCFSLGIDTRENVLYHIETVRQRGKSYVVRAPLNHTKSSPLVEYPRSQKPWAITIDNVSRCVFVYLRGGVRIDQIGYTGKKIGEIPLDPIVSDEGVTATLTLDKTARVLYYNNADELWQKRLDEDEDPEYLDTAEWFSPTSMVVVGKSLAVGFWDTRQVTLWSEEDSFQKWFDLEPGSETGLKQMCILN